jgi:hypothetical protein
MDAQGCGGPHSTAHDRPNLVAGTQREVFVAGGNRPPMTLSKRIIERWST